MAARAVRDETSGEEASPHVYFTLALADPRREDPPDFGRISLVGSPLGRARELIGNA